MQKTILAIVMATLCLNLSTKAQFYKPSDKTFRMDETLPDSFYQTIHQAVNAKTGKTTTIQLKDYKNKLIILDFWATWCGPCIHSLKKMDSLIAPMDKKDFVVIPVTYQTVAEAKPKLDKYKWDMTSIVSDTVLAQIFPHSGIPHQVWIKDGKVIAIPWWTYVNKETILKTIKGEPTNMMMNIQDKVIDPTKPMFVKGNGDVAPYFKTEYSAIGRYQPLYRNQLLEYVTFKDTTVLYCNNVPIQVLFQEAFKPLIFSGFSPEKMIRWEITDELKERLFNNPRQSMNGDPVQDSIYIEWRRQNNYGYSLRYPKNINDTAARKIMQEDLNIFFGLLLGINATIEKSPDQSYLVLRTLNGVKRAEKLLKTKTNKTSVDMKGFNRSYYNVPFGKHLPLSLLAYNKVKAMDLIFVDSTGINSKLKADYHFPKAIDGSLALTQKELARYGLSLKVEKLRLPMLVVRNTGDKKEKK